MTLSCCSLYLFCLPKNLLSAFSVYFWYRIWIVDLQYFEDGERAVIAEREIKQRFKEYRYDGPKFMKGGGETEMFVYDVLGLDIELTA
jgi:hypothetical protein